MLSKNYHTKNEDEQVYENLRLNDHTSTLQKQSKYYSNGEATAIKKRLIDHYEPVSSTNESGIPKNSQSLLQQLQQSLKSYEPVFKEPIAIKKPRYSEVSLQPEKQERNLLKDEDYVLPTIIEQNKILQKQFKMASLQPFDTYSNRKTVNRIDREITSLYKENRNINLQYRKKKFMDIFLGSQKLNF